MVKGKTSPNLPKTLKKLSFKFFVKVQLLTPLLASPLSLMHGFYTDRCWILKGTAHLCPNKCFHPASVPDNCAKLFSCTLFLPLFSSIKLFQQIILLLPDKQHHLPPMCVHPARWQGETTICTRKRSGSLCTGNKPKGKGKTLSDYVPPDTDWWKFSRQIVQPLHTGPSFNFSCTLICGSR